MGCALFSACSGCKRAEKPLPLGVAGKTGTAALEGVVNVSMPQHSAGISLFFPAEGPATVTCDVHPWMRAYAGVSTHPFFAVTGLDGAFSLRGLPAGSFTLAAWHERLGRASVHVDLKEAQSARVEISLDAATPGR